MTDTTKSLLDACYEQVYIANNDPDNIAVAQIAGGALAVGVTGGAALTAAIANPPAALAALTGIMGVHASYGYGAELGKEYFLPMEATAVYAACAGTDGLMDAIGQTSDRLMEAISNTVSNYFSDQDSSTPPVTEAPSPPIDDGFLVMDAQSPGCIDVPSVPLSETIGATLVDNISAQSAFNSPTPDVFDWAQPVIDSALAWGDNSNNVSDTTTDSSSTASSGDSHDGSMGASDS